jgi:hypothetical protein
MESEN